MSNGNKPAEDQHFIPRMYLKGFSEVKKKGKKVKGIGKKQLELLEKTRWTKNYLEVFQDYYNFEKSKETKRIENIQKYSESFLIFGVGLYLLILLKNTVLPFLTF